MEIKMIYLKEKKHFMNMLLIIFCAFLNFIEQLLIQKMITLLLNILKVKL